MKNRLDDLYKQHRIQQLINNGLGKEAAIIKEINAAEKAAGRKLTADEEQKIRQAAGLVYDAQQKPDPVPKIKPEIYSDTLLRMGGKIGAIGTDRDFSRKTFDRLGDIRSDIKTISDKMGSSSLTFD